MFNFVDIQKPPCVQYLEKDSPAWIDPATNYTGLSFMGSFLFPTWQLHDKDITTNNIW